MAIGCLPFHRLTAVPSVCQKKIPVMDARCVTPEELKRREAKRRQFQSQIRNHPQHNFHWHTNHIQDAASYGTSQQ